jgi:hypothetical protein
MIRWRNIFTNRMIDGVTEGIILLIMLLVIFNLWPNNWPFSPFPHFSLFFMHFFSITNSHPLPPNLNIIQPSITNLATTTLSWSTFVFWFIFDWGFSILSKQIYPFFIYLNSILKCYFFAYFCSKYILFGYLLVL